MPPLLTVDGLHNDLSRRRFLTAATAGGLLTACGSGATSSPPAPAVGSRSFTDYRGITVNLSSQPTLIIGTVSAMTGSDYSRLSAIAPTVAQSGSPRSASSVHPDRDTLGRSQVWPVPCQNSM